MGLISNESRFSKQALTVNGCAQLSLDYGDNTLALTNSLFAAVTNYGGITLATNYCAASATPASVFQTVGAGAHYLLNSSYRNLGTTNLRACFENRDSFEIRPIGAA